jgi:hypothetical protein
MIITLTIQEKNKLVYKAYKRGLKAGLIIALLVSLIGYLIALI